MIYIDELRNCIPNSRWRWKESCHLFTDEGSEVLHKFASELGLRASWFHDRDNFPHYDLTYSKRQRALSLGAEEVNLKAYRKEHKL